MNNYYHPGVSIQGGSVWGVSVKRDLCPEGGLCPGGSLSRGSLSGGFCLGGLCLGVSVWGVSVWGSLSRGGLCLRVSLSGRASVMETPLRTVTRGRYASYWNAFLYVIIFSGMALEFNCSGRFSFAVVNDSLPRIPLSPRLELMKENLSWTCVWRLLLYPPRIPSRFFCFGKTINLLH